MNKVILMGRITKDVDVRYAGEMAVAKYTLAVDRRDKDKTTDFINCVAFGKNAEFAEKYMVKGGKYLIAGRIQTGSYTNKDGVKVYTTDVVIESQEFTESKGNAASKPQTTPQAHDGFMNISDGSDDLLPFN